MKATHEAFIQKDRRILGEIVPVDKPISIVIEPSSACDLRCGFCTFSNPEALKARKHVARNMSRKTFDLIMAQIGEFSTQTDPRFARIYFCGLGEVLCNPLLAEFVSLAKGSGLAEKVELVTNGVQLTNKTALALADSGLDTMVISVNGLNSEDYVKCCNTRVDFDKYYEQIKFQYAHKKQIRIDLKTTDAVANTPEREQLFFEMFGDYCDRINIETVAPFHQGARLDGTSGSLNRHGNFFDRNSVKICSLAFYKLCIFSDGRVNFCDQIMGPIDELSIYDQTLTEIWNGEVHRKFMLDLLTMEEAKYPTICRDCNTKCVVLGMKEENIDPYAETVRERILNI